MCMGLEDPSAQARHPFEHREAMQNTLIPKTVALNLGSQDLCYLRKNLTGPLPYYEKRMAIFH